MWPFRTEKREAPYTDQLLLAQFAEAEGKAIGASATAALETAAGMVARSLAAARVGPEPLAGIITRDVLDVAGRSLVRRGEQVFVIDVRDGAMVLDVAGHWDVRGGARPDQWSYRVSVYGPSATRSRVVPASSVVHLMWSVDPERPWRGIGPLGRATSTGSLAGWLEKRLGEESSATVGHVLPMPEEPAKGHFDALKERLAKLGGKTAFVESTRSKGYDRNDTPRDDWQAKRIGANPPQVLQGLRHDAGNSVLAACGIPPSLAAENVDGTSQRESFRRFLHVTLAPLARRAEAEFERKLESSVTLDLRDVNAADISGRARAFQSLVGGGMSIEDAVRNSGLLVGDDQ